MALDPPQLYQPWRELGVYLDKPIILFQGGDEDQTHLNIRNETSEQLTFKLRTTRVSVYKVSPCLGIVPAGGKANISIRYRGKEDEREGIRDRFELFLKGLSRHESSAITIYGSGDEEAARRMLGIAPPSTTSEVRVRKPLDIFRHIWSHAPSETLSVSVRSCSIPCVFTPVEPTSYSSMGTVQDHLTDATFMRSAPAASESHFSYSGPAVESTASEQHIPDSHRTSETDTQNFTVGTLVRATGLSTKSGERLNGSFGTVVGYQVGASNAEPQNSENLTQVAFPSILQPDGSPSTIALRPINLSKAGDGESEQNRNFTNISSTSTQPGSSSSIELKRLFNLIDTNNDGLITRAELIHAIQADSRIRGLVKLSHVNNDTLPQFEHLFQSVDRNQDRKINWLEFYQAFSIGTSDNQVRSKTPQILLDENKGVQEPHGYIQKTPTVDGLVYPDSQQPGVTPHPSKIRHLHRDDHRSVVSGGQSDGCGVSVQSINSSIQTQSHHTSGVAQPFNNTHSHGGVSHTSVPEAHHVGNFVSHSPHTSASGVQSQSHISHPSRLSYGNPSVHESNGGSFTSQPQHSASGVQNQQQSHPSYGNPAAHESNRDVSSQPLHSQSQQQSHPSYSGTAVHESNHGGGSLASQPQPAAPGSHRSSYVNPAADEVNRGGGSFTSQSRHSQSQQQSHPSYSGTAVHESNHGGGSFASQPQPAAPGSQQQSHQSYGNPTADEVSRGGGSFASQSQHSQSQQQSRPSYGNPAAHESNHDGGSQPLHSQSQQSHPSYSGTAVHESNHGGGSLASQPQPAAPGSHRSSYVNPAADEVNRGGGSFASQSRHSQSQQQSHPSYSGTAVHESNHGGGSFASQPQPAAPGSQQQSHQSYGNPTADEVSRGGGSFASQPQPAAPGSQQLSHPSYSNPAADEVNGGGSFTSQPQHSASGVQSQQQSHPSYVNSAAHESNRDVSSQPLHSQSQQSHPSYSGTAVHESNHGGGSFASQPQPAASGSQQQSHQSYGNPTADEVSRGGGSFASQSQHSQSQQQSHPSYSGTAVHESNHGGGSLASQSQHQDNDRTQLSHHSSPGLPPLQQSQCSVSNSQAEQRTVQESINRSFANGSQHAHQSQVSQQSLSRSQQVDSQSSHSQQSFNNSQTLPVNYSIKQSESDHKQVDMNTNLSRQSDVVESQPRHTPMTNGSYHPATVSSHRIDINSQSESQNRQQPPSTPNVSVSDGRDIAKTISESAETSDHIQEGFCTRSIPSFGNGNQLHSRSSIVSSEAAVVQLNQAQQTSFPNLSLSDIKCEQGKLELQQQKLREMKLNLEQETTPTAKAPSQTHMSTDIVPKTNVVCGPSSHHSGVKPQNVVPRLQSTRDGIVTGPSPAVPDVYSLSQHRNVRRSFWPSQNDAIPVSMERRFSPPRMSSPIHHFDPNLQYMNYPQAVPVVQEQRMAPVQYTDVNSVRVLPPSAPTPSQHQPISNYNVVNHNHDGNNEKPAAVAVVKNDENSSEGNKPESEISRDTAITDRSKQSSKGSKAVRQSRMRSQSPAMQDIRDLVHSAIRSETRIETLVNTVVALSGKVCFFFLFFFFVFHFFFDKKKNQKKSDEQPKQQWIFSTTSTVR